MPQKKNSESARLNAVKRELSITIKVLEGELETLCEMLDPRTTKINEENLNDLYLRDSIHSVMLYLKDLRSDCSSKVDQQYQNYIVAQRNFSDWIYEHYNSTNLYNRILDEAYELINDRLDYTGFSNINFNEFKFIQELLWTVKREGILWEDQIDYLVNNNFIELPKEEE